MTDKSAGNLTHSIMEVKEVVRALLASGAKKVSDLKVINVTVKVLDTYVRVALTLDRKVDGYVLNEDDGTYAAGEVKVVFVSLYSLLSMLKQDEDTAFAANHVANNPKSIELILSGAKIDVIQQPVAAGEEYKNPWSDRTDAEATVFDHDTIINHVVSIEVGRFGEKALDKLMDKMLQE